MSEKKEQEKPLAQADRFNIENSDAAFTVKFTARCHRKFIKVCGCSLTIMLIIATIILILMFTVLHVKDPVLAMNSFSIYGLDKLKLNSPMNLTIQADVSVKNPNVASFKFTNMTTYVYYGGTMIGETRIPPGEARPRRTLRMNVSVQVGGLNRDLDTSEVLSITSYTRICGKVKISRVVKRDVVVKLNCNMNLNVRRQTISDIYCRKRDTL